MQLWTAGAGRFWAKAVPSLVALFLVGSIFHTSIVPPRIYLSDCLIAVPLILCGIISIRAREEVDFWTRLSYGLFQAIVLIAVYSNHWHRDIIFGNPYEVFIGWAVLTGLYGAIFAGVTQALSAQSSGRQSDPMQCRKCGYSLRGLTPPRCPECSEPFDSLLLNGGARSETREEDREVHT